MSEEELKKEIREQIYQHITKIKSAKDVFDLFRLLNYPKDIIFDELGLTKEERKEVYLAVCELVKQRIEKARSLRE